MEISCSLCCSLFKLSLFSVVPLLLFYTISQARRCLTYSFTLFFPAPSHSSFLPTSSFISLPTLWAFLLVIVLSILPPPSLHSLRTPSSQLHSLLPPTLSLNFILIEILLHKRLQEGRREPAIFADVPSDRWIVLLHDALEVGRFVASLGVGLRRAVEAGVGD